MTAAAAGVVVLSYGDGPVTRCVTALLDSGLPPEDLFVVHNPTADTPTVDLPDGVASVVLSTNLGYGAGMNAGVAHWRASGRRAVVLCTHDVITTADDIRRLAVRVTEPGTGACGPVLQRESGAMFSAGAVQRWNGDVRHLLDESPGLIEVDWLDGSLLALDLHLQVRIRSDFFLYWEDVVLGADVRAAGHRVVCDRSVWAIAAPGVNLRAPLFTYLMWRNRLLSLRRRPSAWGYSIAKLTAAGAARCVRGGWPRRLVLTVYASALRDGVLGHGGRPPESLLEGTDVR